MEIFPAIDLLGGNVVRLTQGDYNKVDVYGGDPVEVAKKYEADGAKNLHVVDLDGAKDGSLVNFDVISAIAASTGLFIQVGGGIRDEERLKRCLNAGVKRAIIGTAAAENLELLEQIIANYGSAVAVGVDARNGYVTVKGWRETTGLDALEFCGRLDAMGVDNIIYTDISKDGMMQGVNLDIYKILSRDIGAKITASGGISSIDDVKLLQQLDIYAAIIGKSLYTGAIDLREVLALADKKDSPLS